MKKYYIKNCGCDDTTVFDIELTDEELKTIIRVFEENNKVADYQCKPELHIYEYDESKSRWEYNKPLNNNYYELKEENNEYNK